MSIIIDGQLFASPFAMTFVSPAGISGYLYSGPVKSHAGGLQFSNDSAVPFGWASFSCTPTGNSVGCGRATIEGTYSVNRVVAEPGALVLLGLGLAVLGLSRRKRGLDPNVWFGNVEQIASEHIARETVAYMINIYKYYVTYRPVTEASDRRAAAMKGLESAGRGQNH